MASVSVPSVWRGTLNEFLSWLSTTGDIHRPLGAQVATEPSSTDSPTGLNATPSLVTPDEAAGLHGFGS
jgi:hypothetical protein